MISFARLQQLRWRFAMGAMVGATLLAFGVASTATAIYPARGQSARQMDKDKYECHGWARSQSGFDPAQASQPTATSQASPAHASAGGIARGAVAGAAIGELAHNDPGRGAAVGVLGAAVRQRVQQGQAAQQQQAARSQQRANYDRAFGACLEGRGYAVK
jgi:hypothetical protein